MDRIGCENLEPTCELLNVQDLEPTPKEASAERLADGVGEEVATRLQNVDEDENVKVLAKLLSYSSRRKHEGSC